jgi:hypothetical protein
MSAVYFPAALIPLQPGQPVSGVFDLSNTRISVLPEVV